MADRTLISWANHTRNFWWGCTPVSAGCRGCYAMGEVNRLQHNPTVANAFGHRLVEVTRGRLRWTGSLVDNIAATRAKITPRQRPARLFINSLSDTFHEHAPIRWIAQVFAAAADAPQHQFLILTKRPERALEVLTDPGFERLVHAHRNPAYGRRRVEWPLSNVGLGVSVELDHLAGRVDTIMAAPAAFHWISAEPLLGPLPSLRVGGVAWLIVGGESGHKCRAITARPVDLEWMRDLHRRCQAAGTAFHVKQLGSVYARQHPDMSDPAARTLAQWPPDLQIQQFPPFQGAKPA